MFLIVLTSFMFFPAFFTLVYFQISRHFSLCCSTLTPVFAMFYTLMMIELYSYQNVCWSDILDWWNRSCCCDATMCCTDLLHHHHDPVQRFLTGLGIQLHLLICEKCYISALIKTFLHHFSVQFWGNSRFHTPTHSDLEYSTMYKHFCIWEVAKGDSPSFWLHCWSNSWSH